MHAPRRGHRRIRAMVTLAVTLGAVVGLPGCGQQAGTPDRRAEPRPVVTRLVQAPSRAVAEDVRARRDADGTVLARLDLSDPKARAEWHVVVRGVPPDDRPGPLRVVQDERRYLWLTVPVPLPAAFEVWIEAAEPTPSPFFPSIVTWRRAREGEAQPGAPRRAVSTRAEEVEVRPGIRLTAARGHRIVDWGPIGQRLQLDFNVTGREIDLASIEIRVPLATVDTEPEPRAELAGVSLPAWIDRTPGVLRTTLPAADARAFATWVGLPVETRLAQGEAVRFVVHAGATTVADMSLGPDDVGRWHALRAELPASSEPLSLRLETVRVSAEETGAAAGGEPPLALWGVPRVLAATPRSGPAAVLVVVVDTLRADHLSLHGHEVDTTPYLASLAPEAAVFDAAFSQSPWTVPSVASIFTSREPWRLGTTWGTDLQLPPGPPTLAELLRDHGYLAAAFVANLVLAVDVGYARGFDHFGLARNWMGDGADLNNRVFDLLDSQQGERTFLYVHYADPHDPYRQHDDILAELYPGADLDTLREARFPPDDVVEAEQLRRRYEGEIRYTDRNIEALHRAVQARFGDDVLLVVASDHGESFLEHGFFGHGTNLFDEQVRVPLLIHWPGVVPGARIEAPVRNLDLLPTLLDLLGIEAPEGLEGVSLRPHFDGADAAAQPGRFVHAETSSNGPRRHAVRDGEFTYVTFEAYDTQDPGRVRWREPLVRQIERLAPRALYRRGDEGGDDVQARHPEVVARMQRVVDRTELERHVGHALVLRGALETDAPATQLSGTLRVDRGRITYARRHRSERNDRAAKASGGRALSIETRLAPGDVDWIFLELSDPEAVPSFEYTASGGPARASSVPVARAEQLDASADEVLAALDARTPDRPLVALWHRAAPARATDLDPAHLERLKALGYVE